MRILTAIASLSCTLLLIILSGILTVLGAAGSLFAAGMRRSRAL